MFIITLRTESNPLEGAAAHRISPCLSVSTGLFRSKEILRRAFDVQVVSGGKRKGFVVGDKDLNIARKYHHKPRSHLLLPYWNRRPQSHE